MDRIKECRKKKGWTQQDLADFYNRTWPGEGLSKGTLSKYENGNQEPGAERIGKFAELLGVSADYLLGKESPPLYDKGGSREEMLLVPILGAIAAGNPMLALEDVQGHVPVPSDKIHHQLEDYFYLRVQGESMLGAGILPDSLVLIRRQRDVDSGEIAAVMVGDDEATLKRIIKKDGVVVLQPENPAFPVRIFTGPELREIRILGKAVEVTITKKL